MNMFSLFVLMCVGSLVCACGAKSGLRVDGDAGDSRAEIPAPEGDVRVDANEPICIAVPNGARRVQASITTNARLAVVDLVFALDASGSMVDEIETIRARLQDRVVPGVREALPDAAFGLALLGEFPVAPHGSRGVQPYELRAPVDTDPLRVQASLDRIPSWGNADEPEAQIEALYQLATGDGLLPWIEAAVGCARGGTGGACFRRDSLPVMMLITDAPMHNGPPGVPPEEPYAFVGTNRGPHSYQEAIDALRRAGALVVGLGASDRDMISPLEHLRAIARDTGALDDEGNELVFDIGRRGQAIGDEIVAAVERLAEGVPLDVDARVEDIPGDSVDARDIVASIVARAAEPSTNIDRIEGERFVGVRPGTRLSFELTFDLRDVPADVVRFAARVVFRAFGRSRIGVQDVVVLLGQSCDVAG